LWLLRCTNELAGRVSAGTRFDFAQFTIVRGLLEALDEISCGETVSTADSGLPSENRQAASKAWDTTEWESG
jgi:hypothetical protein